MAIRCPDAAVTGVMIKSQTDRFVLVWSFKLVLGIGFWSKDSKRSQKILIL